MTSRSIGQCYQQDANEVHSPHLVDFARCAHETTTFCYGTPEPDSLAAQIAALPAGQRVRVVWEGVVEEPNNYGKEHERPAVVVRSESDESDRLVLRYTGHDPFRRDVRADKVAGIQNSGVVSIELMPTSGRNDA